MSTTRVSAVRVERRRDGAFTPTPTPRLTWTTETDEPDWQQSSAEVRLDGDQVAVLDGPDSVLVDWPFEPLAPHGRHTLEVRVARGSEFSPWSEPVAFQTTFLGGGEWHAAFIGLATPEKAAQPGLLRTEVEIAGELVSAVLYATAQGVYQVEINGHDVDDAVLKPGWTSYQYRMEHEATDVTALLRPGRNGIGVRLAGGWFTEE